MTKLKRCPFCGCEADINSMRDTAYCPNPSCGVGPIDRKTWQTRADDWQPIETLPDEIKKDKTRILGYSWDYNEIEIIRWNPTPKGSYPWEAGMYHRYAESAITHWKPLPTPPQETDDE